MSQAAPSRYETSRAAVARWPSERPLRVLVVIAALALWALLAVSVIGIVYAVILGLVFFFAHVAFITHVRGNGVRLGPDQMPDLHRRVQQLAERLGVDRAPDAYVIQAGGSLNALATRFLGTNFIVLFSDLLEACGDDEGARDFIVAHELGHLAAGHLRWRWLLLPGLAVPFLGSAYSRACEYTSDRYGVAVATDRASALNGICILAAGGKHGPALNRRALVAQRHDLATPWMKLGQWLGTHPSIAHRLEMLEPSLADYRVSEAGARTGALAILALLVLVPTAVTVAVAKGVWPAIEQALQQGQQAAPASQAEPAAMPPAPSQPPDPVYLRHVRDEILSLAALAEASVAQTGAPPADLAVLYESWRAAHPGSPDPGDPFDGGAPYGYEVQGAEFVIWSVGPDRVDQRDDLFYSSVQARQARQAHQALPAQ